MTERQVTHLYVSTACQHELHNECGKAQKARETAAGVEHSVSTCKFCTAPCLCPCHLSFYEEGYRLRDHREFCTLPKNHLGWCGSDG